MQPQIHSPLSSRVAAQATHHSRRKILQIALLGGISLLTAACGSPQAATPPNSLSKNSVVNSPRRSLPAASALTASQSSDVVAPKLNNSPASRSLGQQLPIAVVTAMPIAIRTPEPTSTPPPSPSPAATTIPYDPARLTDLLGQSVTSYAGSIAPRVHNVRRATDLINGATVAPGDLFSFDARVGSQSVANGFTVAYGIVNNNGVPETVPAIAGGICQVATTLFQAVYWAGLPIIRHYHHLYWIAHYGQPPYGQVGLDATVDFPPVDFQFRNTTADWLRIEGTYNNTNVRFRVFGVSPGWKVTSSPTKITNLIKTDRATIRREDPTQPAGYELWIESAEDGFDATIERLVTKNGLTVDRYVFTNHYDPAHNVLVVGTKGVKPISAPTHTLPPTSPALVATSIPTVIPTATSTPQPAPSSYLQSDGRVRVPALVGLPEAQARALIDNVSLQNTYTNYQGHDDLPDQTLNQVSVGAVLSQSPAPGSIVPKGTIVHIAVRKN